MTMLAPVGPQEPPALRYVGLVAVTPLRAGPSCGLPGQAPERRAWVKIQSAKTTKTGQDSTGVDINTREDRSDPIKPCAISNPYLEAKA
jgi:hypothetical protein